MKKVRIIPRLDIKGPNVVKGLQLEGLRVVGNPTELAKRYYDQGADEILYIDIVASLYERNNLLDIVSKTTSAGVFIPMTVAGGVRSLDDVKKLLRAGADKVAINTAATRRPDFIREAVEMFGSQCIVGSIEAKYKDGRWEAYIDNGRECTGRDAIEWAKKLVELGCGELLVTAVDRDGMEKGMDIELIKKITEAVPVPVIGCGGAGNADDIHSCLQEAGCDGVAFGSVLHYNKTTITDVKKVLTSKGLQIRETKEGNETENVSATKPTEQTTKKTVSIIDYEVGNHKSVISAFEALGNPVKIVKTGEEVLNAELLVLPGDGAFGFAMEQLRKQELIQPLQNYIEQGKPLFGICLGMQLLMTESDEFGAHKGLNIIPGRVIKLKPVEHVQEPGYRVPHMGWNTITKPAGADWNNTILQETPNGPENNALAYFVHSHCVVPADDQSALAKTTYGGQEFCTVIKKGNVFGTQFHPEKSGSIGMDIVRQFSSM